MIAFIGIIFTLGSIFSHPSTKINKLVETPPKSMFKNTIVGIGVVEPKSELISIGVELSGVIREVAVKVGDYVRKNDILFILDQREIDAQIFTLEKTLDSFKVQAEDAIAQFAIVNNLEDQRAIAKDDFNRRKYGEKFSLAKVEEVQAQLNQAKTTKERLCIRSPIDGRILEVNVHPGEYASTNILSSPLIRMGDVSTLHVRVEIDEENASRVSPENEVYCVKRGNTQAQHPLTFVRFEPYVQPKQNLAVLGQRVDTRVLRIIYALPKNVSSIFIGQQMDVFINEHDTKK